MIEKHDNLWFRQRAANLRGFNREMLATKDWFNRMDKLHADIISSRNQRLEVKAVKNVLAILLLCFLLILLVFGLLISLFA